MKIPKQEYTAEFKELAVKRVRDGQAVGAVAKELGLIEQTLRNWVKAHAAGKLNAPGTRKITPEEMELSRLRAENIRLRRECEILKKATAYFAKEKLGSDSNFRALAIEQRACCARRRPYSKNPFHAEPTRASSSFYQSITPENAAA